MLATLHQLKTGIARLPYAPLYWQIIQPSLDEIQNAVNQSVQYVSEIGQHIPHWTNLFSSSAQSTPRSRVSHSKRPTMHTHAWTTISLFTNCSFVCWVKYLCMYTSVLELLVSCRRCTIICVVNELHLTWMLFQHLWMLHYNTSEIE